MRKRFRKKYLEVESLALEVAIRKLNSEYPTQCNRLYLAESWLDEEYKRPWSESKWSKINSGVRGSRITVSRRPEIMRVYLFLFKDVITHEPSLSVKMLMEKYTNWGIVRHDIDKLRGFREL